MDAKRFLLLLLLPALLVTACGPIMGQMMKMGEGIKGFEVTRGSLSDLGAGGELLVFGPFEKTDRAFYVCRGEDAAQFAAELEKAGLFRTELHLDRDYRHLRQQAEALREKTPAQLRQELGLDREPAKILFGTLTFRQTTVAPARGVVMDEAFRLELYDLRSRQSTVIEVAVRDLAEDCVPAVVQELARRVRG